MQVQTAVGMLVFVFFTMLACCHCHGNHHHGDHHHGDHHGDHHHGDHHHGDHHHGDHHHHGDNFKDTKCAGSRYSKECNEPIKAPTEDDIMFKNGHLKPFGSHRPPDARVEELPYMISSEDFYMNYVIKHKPVIFKNVAKHWPAFSKWTDEYLNVTYGNVTFHMETKDDDKKNIPKDDTLASYLAKHKQDRYFVDEVLPDMRKDIVLPLALRCEEISNYFFVSYIFMSNGGTSSKIHIDTDENLLSVLHGHKETRLVSPKYSANLYADDGDLLGVSNIDPLSVDLIKFPRVKNVRYLLAVMEEGDALYIPQMWWHQVVSRKEQQQATAMWWKSKPFWKEQGRTATPMEEVQRRKNVEANSEFSFANVLAEYEAWVQEVSQRVPRIKCTSQRNMMSDYRWETDKEPDAPVTLGDGGDVEEEKTSEETHSFKPDLEQRRKDDERKLKNKEDLDMKGMPCDFDRGNPKSPCNHEICFDMADENLQCVRYVLDYCKEYKDRGCVVQLPHLLNKKTEKQWREIHETESGYKSG